MATHAGTFITLDAPFSSKKKGGAHKGALLTLGDTSGAQDTDPPTVANILPLAAADLFATSEISFDVLDSSAAGFRKVVVIFKFEKSAVWETAYDGELFAPGYAGSTVAVISNGFHFVLRRLEPFLSKPTIRIIAIDKGGNEAVN